MLNAKLERIHRIISYAYFFFVGFGIFLIISRFFRGRPDDYSSGLAFIFVIGPGGLFHWYAAKGAKKGTKWGRYMSIGIGILLLFGFPLGTALGVYILSQTGAKWKTGLRKNLIKNEAPK